MARVRLKNLTKKFGDVVAVKELNLDVEDKEFLVLLGPSGCGKTTILRCIAGLESIDDGEIYIGDTLVNDIPPRDRDIAMVFQSYALYPHMSVFDNLAFPLKMRGASNDEIKKRVTNIAELLRITHLLNRKPKQLSGGEAQRVALGRAIVRNPKVFLMDEPLSNLDAKLRVYMRADLKRLQKDLEVTTIYVTHDQVEAMTMADRVAIIKQGILQQLGSAHEIFAAPANMFVAGFVGSPPMNFIECTFTENVESCILDAAAFKLSIPKDLIDVIKDRATSSELVIGIRPEDVIINKNKTLKTFIQAEVYVTEPMGSEIIVDLKLGDIFIKARISSDFAIGMGEKVWMGFRKEKIHVFDKKTEIAII